MLLDTGLSDCGINYSVAIFAFSKWAMLGIEDGCFVRKLDLELIGLLLVTGNMNALGGPLCNGAGGSLHVPPLGLMALGNLTWSDIAGWISNFV
jgi:hypothetical protein